MNFMRSQKFLELQSNSINENGSMSVSFLNRERVVKCCLDADGGTSRTFHNRVRFHTRQNKSAENFFKIFKYVT